jgi:hypothetical protein
MAAPNRGAFDCSFDRTGFLVRLSAMNHLSSVVCNQLARNDSLKYDIIYLSCFTSSDVPVMRDRSQ